MVQINPYWERCTTPRSVAAGEVIFREGEPADAIYVIASGKVAIGMHSCGPGDLLGEAALIGEEPRAETATAIQSTELMGITTQDFWSLMGSDSQFRQVVTESLITGLLAARNHLRLQEDELLYMINHDLRQSLMIIMGSFEVLREESIPSQDTVCLGQRESQRVWQGLEHLVVTMNLQKGWPRLDPKPLNLAEIIERCVTKSQSHTNSAIRLSGDLSTMALPEVVADALRTEWAILDLITNAVRLSRGGEVTVRAWSEDGAVYVAVDNGAPGIPTKEREAIFKRPGLLNTPGLLYPRLVAEAHGGELRIEDRPDGQGTRVLFSLPVKPILPE